MSIIYYLQKPEYSKTSGIVSSNNFSVGIALQTLFLKRPSHLRWPNWLVKLTQKGFAFLFPTLRFGAAYLGR